MSDQETVDRLAMLAQPRLISLLRLRSVRHVYDPTPGALNSSFVENGDTIKLDKWKSSSQPYKDIERFLGDDKIMQFIVGPGLLPIITSLSQSIMGKTLLVTRKIKAKNDDKGVVGHLDAYGVRIMMHFDEAAGETILEWQTLFGVR